VLLAAAALSLAAAAASSVVQAASSPSMLPTGNNTGDNSGLLYSVDGIALGDHFPKNQATQDDFKCQKSTQFSGYTFCTKQVTGSEARGAFQTTFSILHAAGGTVVYVNRFQSPAYWGPSEVRDDIERYSKKVNSAPRITELPSRPGFPAGTLAVWGQATLEPLDDGSLRDLASNKAIQKGFLVDFIGDFSRSARAGLPVYRVGGGPGFVWIASHDDEGQGTLRFLAVNASSYSDKPKTPLQTSDSTAQKPAAAQQTDSSSDRNAGALYGAVNEASLLKNQAIRDSLFKTLQATATQYTFDYLVITLPPGTLPNVKVSVPVSHIRYSDTVFFAFDSFSLERAAQSAVLDFANTLKKDSSYRSILVVGHTDAVGSDDYNDTLSKNRASTVALALRSAGVQDRFLGIVPMGKQQPVASNSTADGRARNRRVEFFISDVPGATKAAIEQIKYNPCFRYDNDLKNPAVTDCAAGPKTVPVLPASGDGQPLATVDLARSALPVNPHPTRDPLPAETLQRPSLKELQTQ
jgi:outer membrane protein OmpA-like peptidoglycan-associated protein